MAVTGKKLIFIILVSAIHITNTGLATYGLKKIEQENDTEVNTNNYKVCQTKDCIKIAKEFLDRLNKSVDPCDDFYGFSCGGWTEDKIPPSSVFSDEIMIFIETIEHRIKGVLESKLELTDIPPIRQAKKWYRSCMDTESLEHRGIKPIESLLMQVGGWPIAMDDKEWDPKEYTWQVVDSHYTLLTGRHSFYKIEPHKYVYYGNGGIKIDPLSIPLESQFPLASRNYTGDNYETYVRLIERVADMFVQHNWTNVSKERVRKEAEKIVDFEKELYKIKEGPIKSQVTIFEDLTEKFETNMMEVDDDPKLKINWKSVIQELFKRVNIEIDPFTKITLTHMLYFKRLGPLLKKTPARTIVNYIHWKFVSDVLKYTTEAMRNEIFEVLRKEYGTKSRPPRWSECVNNMRMSHAVAYVFVKDLFPESTEIATRQMIKNIQLEMESRINNSNWLDETSKTIIKDKLNSMRFFLGFPDWYKNETAVINYYKGLTISTDYFDNALSYMRYARKKTLKSLIIPKDQRDPWDKMSPITVNAMYDFSTNSMNLPGVNFQAPLFTTSLPESVNYGIAGFTVGHEMSHGFDNIGVIFPMNRNKTMLSYMVLGDYLQKAECFLDQFDVYYNETIPSPSEYQSLTGYVPGNKASQTIKENIADTTGIQVAFEAFQKQNTKDSLRLPGLEEYTDEQLFFISFAAQFCKISTPEYKIKERESSDLHSPANLRVIGAVTNTKDFGNVFNCPEGKAMNPTKKCSLW